MTCDHLNATDRTAACLPAPLRPHVARHLRWATECFDASSTTCPWPKHAGAVPFVSNNHFDWGVLAAWLGPVRAAIVAGPAKDTACADGEAPPGEAERTAFHKAGLRTLALARPDTPLRYTQVPDAHRCIDPLAGLATVVVRSDYEVLRHAAALNDAGHVAGAFDLLDSPAASEGTDPLTAYRVTLERMAALLALPAAAWPVDPVRRAFYGQQDLYRIQNMRPACVHAAGCQAHLWRRAGRPDLGLRLLNTVRHEHEDPWLARVAPQVESAAVQMTASPEARQPPQWPGHFRPRLLCINHPNSDCGFDTLYYGLCQVLGTAHVVEYPYKPHLHGAALDPNVQHPNATHHPAPARSLHEIAAMLEAGAFDVLVFSDVYRLTPRAETRRLLDAAPDVPMVLLDTQDEGWDNTADLLDWCGRASYLLHFKREMLNHVQYAPRTRPLPLAYMDWRVPEDTSGPRDVDVFWAGHRTWGLRRVYLDALEERFGGTFPLHAAPDAYREGLRRARIALDIFGQGFDTVRQYEITAHGALLLSERKPIAQPHGFVDGEHAVFFDDLPELLGKVDYYRTHREEAAAIACAGRQHFLARHTSRARARQFLGWLEAEMEQGR